MVYGLNQTLEEELLFRIEDCFMGNTEVCRFKTLAEDVIFSLDQNRRELSQKNIKQRYNNNIRTIRLNDSGEIYCELKREMRYIDSF